MLPFRNSKSKSQLRLSLGLVGESLEENALESVGLVEKWVWGRVFSRLSLQGALKRRNGTELISPKLPSLLPPFPNSERGPKVLSFPTPLPIPSHHIKPSYHTLSSFLPYNFNLLFVLLLKLYLFNLINLSITCASFEYFIPLHSSPLPCVLYFFCSNKYL